MVLGEYGMLGTTNMNGIQMDRKLEQAIKGIIGGKIEINQVLKGGYADGQPVEKYDREQLAMGIEVEMEHTNDPRIATEIAMDHLEEIGDYYTRLSKMEEEAKAEALTDEIEEPEYIEESRLSNKLDAVLMELDISKAQSDIIEIMNTIGHKIVNMLEEMGFDKIQRSVPDEASDYVQIYFDIGGEIGIIKAYDVDEFTLELSEFIPVKNKFYRYDSLDKLRKALLVIKDFV